MEKVIECKNITHYYGEKLIYENLNFEVEKGKVLGLLGKKRNGKNHHHQHIERLFKTPFRRVLPSRREHESPHSRHESQDRLITGRSRATHLFHDRANRKVLPGLFPELETRRVLRV